MSHAPTYDLAPPSIPLSEPRGAFGSHVSFEQNANVQDHFHAKGTAMWSPQVIMASPSDGVPIDKRTTNDVDELTPAAFRVSTPPARTRSRSAEGRIGDFGLEATVFNQPSANPPSARPLEQDPSFALSDYDLDNKMRHSPVQSRPPRLPRNRPSAFTCPTLRTARSDFSTRSGRDPHVAQPVFHTSDEPNIEIWRSGQPYQYLPPPEDHWKHCHDLVSHLDSEMCESWKAEVDNLLIFAGLFSATVTAFIIDSYKWLLPDSKAYDSQLLALIYSSIDPSQAASIIPTIQDAVAESQARRINIYWFLSLTLSLTTVLVGIICDQWIREYVRSGSHSPKARLALRQMRYEGLVAWEVPRIISYLPFLLQTAFVLFLIGIVELLWMLDIWVALPISILVGSVLFLLVFTILAPTLQWLLPRERMLRLAQCPYKSPQSLAVLRGVLKIYQMLRRLLKKKTKTIASWDWPRIESVWGWSWTHQDLQWREMRDRLTEASTQSEDVVASPCSPRPPSVDGVASSEVYNIVHDDEVGALKYVAASFHPVKETIFSSLHCIHELPFHRAELVVKELYLKWGGKAALGDLDAALKLVKIPSTSLEPRNLSFLGSRSGGAGEQELAWDLINAAYLETYVDHHTQVRAPFWEARIRIMNRLSPRALVETSFAGLPSSPLNTTFLDLPEEIHLQLLATFHTLIRQDSVTARHLGQLWSLIKIFLAPDPRNFGLGTSSFPSPSQSRIRSRQAMVFATFTLLNAWILASPSNLPTRHSEYPPADIDTILSSSLLTLPFMAGPVTSRMPYTRIAGHSFSPRHRSTGNSRGGSTANNDDIVLDRRGRVKLCIDGLHRALYPGIYEVWSQPDLDAAQTPSGVQAVNENYARLRALATTIDRAIIEMGGWDALVPKPPPSWPVPSLPSQKRGTQDTGGSTTFAHEEAPANTRSKFGFVGYRRGTTSTQRSGPDSPDPQKRTPNAEEGQEDNLQERWTQCREWISSEEVV